MLDIQFVPIEESEYFNIVVNGIAEPEKCNDPHFPSFTSKKVFDEIIRCSPEEVFNYFDEFNFNYLDSNKQEVTIFVHGLASAIDYPLVITIYRSYNLNNWDKGFTFSKFKDAFKKIFLGQKNGHVEDSYDFMEENDLSVYFHFDHYFSTLNDHIELCLQQVDTLVESTYLIAADNIDSFISVFDFPDSIKTPCQQYLMYFGQFLSDLGIEVETELKEQAHSTLFSVTPKDKGEALDKIREALDIYINAPALNNNSFLQIENQDVAFIQLQANIMHLKSQLMFSHAAIQMKDAAIESLQLSNYQLKQLNIGHENSGKKQDEESVIEGIVSVKKFEGKGFSVNTPEILRKLKRVFRKTND